MARIGTASAGCAAEAVPTTIVYLKSGDKSISELVA